MKKLALCLVFLMVFSLFFACTPVEPDQQEHSGSEDVSLTPAPDQGQSVTPSAPATLTARFPKEGEQFSQKALKILDTKSDPTYLTDLLVQAEGDMQDVTFFTLKLNDEGLFEQHDVIQVLEKVSSGQEMIFSFSMPGDLPSHGISFRDGSGAIHYFFISTSGKDGSLIFRETEHLSDIHA